ncbi:ZGLP1 [Branchiostoma lanceolatum]|uniref:ZGLP1 protein n=1 Tax=Branchiostoma lanceolatum TaxID=7740 RepID=A0A8J9YY82_BRALA|nr:ZGLP1 [Branchiostoma lanceolatum]
MNPQHAFGGTTGVQLTVSKTSHFGGMCNLMTGANIPFCFTGANRWQSVLDWGRYQGFFPGLDEVRYTAPYLPPGGVRVQGGDTVLLPVAVTSGHSSDVNHNYASAFSTTPGGNQGFYDASGNTSFRPRADSAGSTGAVSRKLASLAIDKSTTSCSPNDIDELPDASTVETSAAPPGESYWNSMAVTDVSEPEEGSGPGDSQSRATEYYRPADITLSCLHTAAMGNSGTQAIRSHNRRKPAKPTKSPARFDPAFKGVTFQIETLPHPKPSLRIRSYFSIRRRSQAARPRRFSESDATSYRRRSGSLTETTSGSEHEDPQPVGHSHGAKQCASCDTKKTPLWRDAEDGTPLCNACGIRYKKYRVRCTRCWHVPKKDGKSYPNCGRCGDLLRVSIFRRYSI